MASALLCAPGAARCGPWLELRTYHSAAGGDLEVQGGRFVAASTVRLSLLRAGRRIPLGDATVDERGAFFKSVYLPVTLAPGSYQVVAAGHGHVVARAPLELTSALPGSAPPPSSTLPRLSATLPSAVLVDRLQLKRRGTAWPWTVAAIAVAAGAILAVEVYAVRRRPS